MSSVVVRRVLAWYADARRPLPWREPGTTPWGVLVSEFMCQQTQVDRVAPIWQEWMARWPRPRDLAAASPAEAIRAWGRLGYPRRARWLHGAAAVIARQWDDTVPAGTDDLLALPGVGEYTTAAVQAFAFGMPSVVLDTNVRRVIARSIEGQAIPRPSLTNDERQRARALVDAADTEPGRAAQWSQAVMELGALVCTSRSPDCARCPIARQCAWQRVGAPPAEWVPRRQAAFQGSDRQARGRVLAILRESSHPVPASAIEDAIDDLAQRDRAVDGLIADGLIMRNAVGDFVLPS